MCIPTLCVFLLPASNWIEAGISDIVLLKLQGTDNSPATNNVYTTKSCYRQHENAAIKISSQFLRLFSVVGTLRIFSTRMFPTSILSVGIFWVYLPILIYSLSNVTSDWVEQVGNVCFCQIQHALNIFKNKIGGVSCILVLSFSG